MNFEDKKSALTNRFPFLCKIFSPLINYIESAYIRVALLPVYAYFLHFILQKFAVIAKIATCKLIKLNSECIFNYAARVFLHIKGNIF